MNVIPKTRSHGYEVKVAWTGAAAGPTRTYAGYSREHTIACGNKPAFAASADRAFRGNPELPNPEELLVAALSSCHLLSYLAVCALEEIAVVSYEDEASGTMLETGGAGRFSRVTLRPRVTIEGDRIERALELHDVAHESCFIANSMNFPVECEPVVTRA